MVALQSNGFLPPGVHEMTLAQVKTVFGAFSRSDRRPQLFAKLEELIGHAQAVGFVRYLIVDGSFVTAEPEPGDIDLIVAIDPAILSQTPWIPRDYNMLSSKRLRKKYPFDVLVAPEGSEVFDEYLDLFRKVKYQPGKFKGVVKVGIRG
jgi:hypothetical protein